MTLRAVREMFACKTTVAKFGGVDVLVNKRRHHDAIANIADTDDASFDKQIAINLKGTFQHAA